MSTELAKAYVQIVPSAKGIKSALEDVLGKDLPEQGKKTGKETGSSISGAIKTAIAAAGIGTVIKSALNEGAALQQSLGGVETLFKNSADTVVKNANIAFETAGLSANEYMENVTGFSASLLKGLNGDTAKAAKIADTAMVDMADNANKMGTDMGLIQNAYQGFAKQNYTMLDNLKLGYGGTQAEMAKLINDSGVLGDKIKVDAKSVNSVSFDKMIEAIHVVQTRLGITGTTSKEAATTFSGSFASMQASAKNLMGALTTGNNEDVANAMKALTGTVKTFIVGNLIPMLKSLFSQIPVMLGTAFHIDPSAMTTILKVVGVAITTFTAFSKAIQLVKVAQAALNIVMNMNPIGLIIAGIAALVAGFIALWKKSESFRNFWVGLWNNIKGVASSVANWFKSVWGTIADFVKPVFSKIASLASSAFNGIKEMLILAWGAIKAVWDTVAPYFKVIWNSIKTVFSVAKEIIGGYFKVAWEYIKLVWSVAVQYFKLIWNNIKAVFSVVKDVIGGFFKAAWNNIKIVWDLVVGYFKMIWNNIKLIFSVVKSVFTGDFKGAWDGIKGIWNNVTGYFKKVWDGIKGIFGNVVGFFKNAFSSAWNGIKNIFSNVGSFFGGLWDTIVEKFSTIGTKVADAIGGAFKAAINGAIWVVEGAINLIPNAINGAINLINKLPDVNIPTMPTISLPRLAKGTVATKATPAIFGEDGAEAAVPLEKHTGWMDVIASRISNKLDKNKSNKGNKTINVYINIDEFKAENKEQAVEWIEFIMQKVEEKIERERVVFA